MASQCPNCGTEVRSEYKFCRQCGTPLGAAGTRAGPAPGVEPPPPPRQAAAPQAEATRYVSAVPPERPAAPPPQPSYRVEPSRGERRCGRRWMIVVPVVIVVLLAAGGAVYYFGGETVRSYLPGAATSGAAKPSARAEQYVGQGMTYASMRDYDNAIKEFTRAIELAPAYAVAYANRGVAYMQQKKYNKALDDLTKAAQLNAKDKMVHYNLAALHAVMGQKDRAFDSLDKALELGFDQYEALRNDPDLAGLRNDAEFQKVLEKHKVFLK